MEKDSQSKPLQKAMDFLPKDQRQLQDKSYWKQFFEFDRFKEGFEWYASFEDLQTYLKQHIKQQDDIQKVLVPGCGNSDLSQKLLTNLEVTNLEVESIDYEDQIVQKMEESKPKDLSLSFKVGDCTNLTDLYPTGDLFQFAVDKGTLDAIAVDDNAETVGKCQAYFNEVIRVLDDKGVFMFVSLLQPHVLKIVLDFFILENDVNLYQKQNLFQVKIQQIKKIEGYAEKQFIKYFVSVKKNFIDVNNPKAVTMRQQLQNSIGCRDSFKMKEEFFNYDQTIEKIKVDQQLFMIAPTLKVLDADRDIQMNCFDYKSEDNTNVPKYVIHIVDSGDKNLLKKNICTAIIIPQGRETESVFATEMGRQSLCSQVESSRLIVIFLGHGHTFSSLEVVKDELSSKILELSPALCNNYEQIPVMAAGEDIGEKKLIDLAADGIEGMIVQDMKNLAQEGVFLRQVIYENKYDQIQSEIQIVYRDPKKHEIKDSILANSEMCPPKKGKVAILNHTHLTNEYQQGMLAALFMTPGFGTNSINALHLGTGAGIMPMFLKEQLGDKLTKVTTIDNNPSMLKVAEKYFGFLPDDKIESLCTDAYEFVQKKENASKYDLIIMDINYTEEDLNISPPWKFLDTEFLQKVVDLADDNALIALNVLYYSKEAKQKVFDNISAVKGVSKMAYFEPEESNNRVFLLSTNKAAGSLSLLDYDQNTKSLESVIKNLGVNKGSWMKEMGMSDQVKQIKELSCLFE